MEEEQQQEQQEPKPHGGARQGAGRKAKGKDLGKLRMNFRLSKDVYEILQEQMDKTAYVEAAVREKYKRSKWY